MKKKYKIAFITTRLSKGGAQIQLLNFIKMLPVNFEANIITIKDKGALQSDYEKYRIPIYSSDFRFKISIIGFTNLLKHLRSVNPDIVFTIGFGDSLFWGRLAAVLLRIKYVYSSLHTFPELGGNFDFFNLCLKNVNTRYLPVSEKMRIDLINKYTLKHNKVTTLANGIDLKEIELLNYYTPDQYVTDILKKINNKIVLIQVGKLIYYKNQFLTLRAFHTLLRENILPPICLLIVGDGPDREDIQDFIEENRLHDNVILTGYMSSKDTLYLISISDIVILPSKSEAFPNILVEASSLKKAIITSNVGGCSEIIMHKKTGLTISDNSSSNELADAMKLLILNEEIRLEYGEKAFEHVKKKYTLSKKVETFCKLLEIDIK